MAVKHVGQLKHDTKNPRKHNPRNLKVITDSLHKVGFARSIVIDEDDNILAGNGVTEAAVIAGIERVVEVEADGETIIAVRRRGLTEEQKQALKYYDNRASDLAEWEPLQIAADLEAGLDLDGLFNPDEIAAMLEAAGTELLGKPKDVEPQIDRAKELQEKWGTATGQVWQLGRHRLIVGDCTDRAMVERLMEGERARLVLTDPPYEIDTVGGGILGDDPKMSAIRDAKIDTFDPDRLTRLAETSVYFCNKPLIPNYIKLAEKWGASWDLAISHKTWHAANWGGHLATDLEYIFVIGKQSPISGQEPELYSKLFTGMKTGVDSSLGWAKPVALCEKFTRLYTQRGEIILDTFLGSGTTLIACENLNRQCRGIEIDPGYCAVTIQRWVDLTGQQPQRVSD